MVRSEQIFQSTIKPSANIYFRNRVPTLANSIAHSLDCQINIRQPQIEKVNVVPFCSQFTKEALITFAGKSLSMAKLLRRKESSPMRVSMSRPASIATAEGAKGDNPVAIRSAFTNSLQSAK